MSKQVLDREQMQHLKELGVDTNKASMCWTTFNEDTMLSIHDEYCYESASLHPIPTFTLQDILDLLPLIIEYNSDKYELRIKRMVFASGVKYAVLYEEQEYINWHIMQSYENLIDAVYEMLCWCIENGYVETNKED